MSEEKSKETPLPEATKELKTITFHYIKSNLFRVAPVHGMWGGPTGHGDITVSFFNERAPIPQEMALEVNENGTLGKELRRVSKQGVVREVEIELVMSTSTAETLCAWLQEKIKAAKAIQAEIQKNEAK
jgi:hypothetical protein